MLRNLLWNVNRGGRNLQLYELGKVYRRAGEQRSLILAGAGALRSKSVHENEREFNFFDLKGDVEEILAAFNLQPGPVIPDGGKPVDAIPAYYHPGRSARFSDVAVFGELHPDVAEAFKLRQRVFIAELDAERIMRSRKIRLAQPVARFPSIRRDLSLVLGKTTRYADAYEVIAGANIAELIRVEPFDRLDSGPFPESSYGLSISLIYQSAERTLTDAEVEKFDRQIVALLEERLGAALRK
jgi:phenylalanyl-tRNA synthetase beta chain